MVSQELDRTGPSETGFSWQRKEGLESLGPAGVTLSKACCRNQRPNGLFQNVFTWTGVGILGKGGKGEAHRAGRSSTGSPQRGRGQQKWPPLPRRLLWAKSWAWSPRTVPWGKHQGRLGTWSSVMTLEEGLRPKEPGRSGAQPSLLWAGRSQHPGRARAGRTPLRVVWFLDAPVTLQNVGAARATTACLGQPSFWASARSCRIRTRGESDQGQRPVFLQLGQKDSCPRDTNSILTLVTFSCLMTVGSEKVLRRPLLWKEIGEGL